MSCPEARRRAQEDSVAGRFVPECDLNDDYRAVQTHVSTGFSFCVDPKTGKKFDGSETRSGLPDCSQYMQGRDILVR